MSYDRHNKRDVDSEEEEEERYRKQQQQIRQAAIDRAKKNSPNLRPINCVTELNQLFLLIRLYLMDSSARPSAGAPIVSAVPMDVGPTASTQDPQTEAFVDADGAKQSCAANLANVLFKCNDEMKEILKQTDDETIHRLAKEPKASIPCWAEKFQSVADGKVAKNRRARRRQPQSINRKIKKLAAREENEKAKSTRIPPVVEKKPCQFKSHSADISSLPANDVADELVEKLDKNYGVIVVGSTGCGKTIALPLVISKSCGKCIVTQPKRVPLVHTSNYMRSQLGDVQAGENRQIGRHMRFESENGKNLEYCTDGYLEGVMLGGDWERINSYYAVILDEAHERTAIIDTIMMLFKERWAQNLPTPKLLILSATICVQKFLNYLSEGDRPIGVVLIKAPRRFNIEPIYLPPRDEADDGENFVDESGEEEEKRKAGRFHRRPHNLNAVEKAAELPEYKNGDVLLFESGKEECLDTVEGIREQQQRLGRFQNLVAVPLFAEQPMEEQSAILNRDWDAIATFAYVPPNTSPNTRRLAVISTNVAESSVTLENVRVVIDTGVAKQMHSTEGTKLLLEETISQQEADQRMGRGGRTGESVCFRLYSEENFDNFPESRDPEILRCDLTDLLLRLRLSGRNIDLCPYMTAPPPQAVKYATEQLDALDYFDDEDDKQMSQQAYKVQTLPVSAKNAKLIYDAWLHGCLCDALLLVAVLEAVDSNHPICRVPGRNETEKSYFGRILDENFIHKMEGELVLYYEMFKDAYPKLETTLQKQIKQEMAETRKNDRHVPTKELFLCLRGLRAAKQIHHQLFNHCKDWAQPPQIPNLFIPQEKNLLCSFIKAYSFTLCIHTSDHDTNTYTLLQKSGTLRGVIYGRKGDRKRTFHAASKFNRKEVHFVAALSIHENSVRKAYMREVLLVPNQLVEELAQTSDTARSLPNDIVNALF